MPRREPRTIAQDNAAAKLRVYRATVANRDLIVREALDTGLSKTEVHEESGLSRATIDRIDKKRRKTNGRNA